MDTDADGGACTVAFPLIILTTMGDSWAREALAHRRSDRKRCFEGIIDGRRISLK
jgi:hypothetical protein